jgi:hypothetical protein
MHQPPENKGGLQHKPKAARTEDLGRAEGSTEYRKINDSKVGFFASLKARAENMPIETICRHIKNGKWAKIITSLRQLDNKAYDNEKKNLPCFLVSGPSNGGHKKTDITSHSGYLQLDIDHVKDGSPEELRDRFVGDPHIWKAFVSPGGDGVKAIMKIPADLNRHKGSFRTAQEYMVATYGVHIDISCSDVSRVCFVSYDPGLISNGGTTPLPVPDEQSPSVDIPPHPTNNTPTHHNHSSVFCILDAKSWILHNTPLIEDWPNLRPLYLGHIASRIRNVQRGTRNKAIVEIISSLFCVVVQQIAIVFAREFVRQHEEIFRGYPEADFNRETLALWGGCETSYQNSLSGKALAAYQSLLNDEQRTAFRICHTLSQCNQKGSLPSPQFFLSCHQLAIRLGMVDMQAGRILKDFQNREIIRKIQNGTLRTKGQAGTASHFEWIL